MTTPRIRPDTVANFRLAISEDAFVKALAKEQGKSKATMLREIITEYTLDPAPLAAAFVERINRAIFLRQRRAPEARVQVGIRLPVEMRESLGHISDQTGATIETIVSLMVGGHMIKHMQGGVSPPQTSSEAPVVPAGSVDEDDLT